VNVTLDEAILIYAKASRAWFGPLALQRTEERVEMARKAGDLEGIRVWERVKRVIAELERIASCSAPDLERRRRA